MSLDETYETTISIPLKPFLDVTSFSTCFFFRRSKEPSSQQRAILGARRARRKFFHGVGHGQPTLLRVSRLTMVHGSFMVHSWLIHGWLLDIARITMKKTWGHLRKNVVWANVLFLYLPAYLRTIGSLFADMIYESRVSINKCSMRGRVSGVLFDQALHSQPPRIAWWLLHPWLLEGFYSPHWQFDFPFFEAKHDKSSAKRTSKQK
jgi:hypothetical protein